MTLVEIGRMAFLAWSLYAGLWDLLCRKVPNWWLGLGGLGAAGLLVLDWRAGRIGAEAWLTAAAVIPLCLLYWSRRWWGGADAKFMIASVLAFPTAAFVAAQLLGQLGASLAGARSGERSFPAVAVMALCTLLHLVWTAWGAG